MRAIWELPEEKEFGTLAGIGCNFFIDKRNTETRVKVLLQFWTAWYLF